MNHVDVVEITQSISFPHVVTWSLINVNPATEKSSWNCDNSMMPGGSINEWSTARTKLSVFVASWKLVRTS